MAERSEAKSAKRSFASKNNIEIFLLEASLRSAIFGNYNFPTQFRPRPFLSFRHLACLLLKLVSSRSRPRSLAAYRDSFYLVCRILCFKSSRTFRRQPAENTHFVNFE